MVFCNHPQRVTCFGLLFRLRKVLKSVTNAQQLFRAKTIFDRRPKTGDAFDLIHANSMVAFSLMQGVRLCLSVVSGIELAGLFHAYNANLTRFDLLCTPQLHSSAPHAPRDIEGAALYDMTLPPPFRSWEPLWVIMMETVSYFIKCIDPDAGKVELASGVSIRWFQYVGWLVTCPVLLM